MSGIELNNNLTILLKDTKDVISSLKLKYCGEEYVRRWFNDLCKLLTNSINAIGKFCNVFKSDFGKNEKKNTLLYLTQILTVLSYLIDIFVEESNIKYSIVELRKYATKRLLFCVEELEFTLLQNKTEDCAAGNFIDWMDVAIDNVLQMDVADSGGDQLDLVQFNDVKASFEEVLSYGMSIAQVATQNDCKVIKGSSQSVLETLTCLQCEMTKEQANKAMVDLFKEACINKLCKLEENVNLAVLRLCADVFSQYTTLLNTIQTFCLDSSNKGKVEELEGIVADFDLHVDRIMQIGLFAVSCSSEGINAIQIKSCLASLEALETELVPAFYTLLSDNSDGNQRYARLLKMHWEQQAYQLKERIYHIIEPYTFCQVINQKMMFLVERLSIGKKETVNLDTLQCWCAEFLNYGTLMKEFITSILAINIDSIDKHKLETHLVKFKRLLNETNVAVRILLPHYNTDVTSYNRILKRCKIVLTLGTALQNVFEQDPEDKENKDNHSLDNPKNNSGQVNNRFLEHIMNKGKKILNERSILYKTPRKNALKPIEVTSIDINSRCSLSNRSNTSSHRKYSTMSFTRKTKTEISFDFTGILNDLTNISVSISKGSS